MASQDFRACGAFLQKNARKPSPFSLRQLPAEKLWPRRGQPSQTLKNTPKREPRLHRPLQRPVRACVRGCVCARADAQVAGKPPLPSGSSSFPACFGPAKWEETQDGGSRRELRLQPTAVRLPDLVSGRATSATGGLWQAGLCRQGQLISRSEPNGPNILGLTGGEVSVGPGGVWRSPGSGQAQKPRKPRLGALRRWLEQPLGQSAGCRGASGPWSQTYPTPECVPPA